MVSDVCFYSSTKSNESREVTVGIITNRKTMEFLLNSPDSLLERTQ